LTFNELEEILMQNELFNSEQAAEYLSISARTLANWRTQGHTQISYVKIGRCVRYRKSTLDDFLMTHSVNARGE